MIRGKIYAFNCLCGFQAESDTLAPPACRECGKPMELWLSRHSARSGVTQEDIKYGV
ncbi:hypothetical protein [Sphingomonas sp.]|uniref:hypothetical protein n=1 Tax=Sphingomonas sp. TaxID=28214 RepID=UPI00307E396F